MMDALGPDHTPHERRRAFETRVRLAGADEVALDKIIGHKSATSDATFARILTQTSYIAKSRN
jgi:hypothetical protein